MVDRGVEFVCIRTTLIIHMYIAHICACANETKIVKNRGEERDHRFSAFRPKLSLNDDAIVNYNQEEILCISRNSTRQYP